MDLIPFTKTGKTKWSVVWFPASVKLTLRSVFSQVLLIISTTTNRSRAGGTKRFWHRTRPHCFCVYSGRGLRLLHEHRLCCEVSQEVHQAPLSWSNGAARLVTRCLTRPRLETRSSLKDFTKTSGWRGSKRGIILFFISQFIFVCTHWIPYSVTINKRKVFWSAT